MLKPFLKESGKKAEIKNKISAPFFVIIFQPETFQMEKFPKIV
jgi:hypothetical protein